MPSHKHKKKKKSNRQQKKHISSESDEGGLWRKVKLSNSESEDSTNEERSTSLMPSYKRKKKKKSNRQQKKHISSESDEGGLWRKVKLSNSESEDSTNEERLTSLVRKSYLNYLQQALTQNFENRIKESKELSGNSMQELVIKWSSTLEQKALRACMISELYRRSMVYSINKIKASTNEGQLYMDDKSVSSLKLKLPLNKSTQTDKLCCEVETQTQTSVTSLLELPLPMSPSNRPYDPAIDFSSILPQASDVCNITSTSDFCASAQSVLSTDKNSILESVDKTPFGSDVYKNCFEKNQDSEICLKKNTFSKCRKSYICSTPIQSNISLNGQVSESIHEKCPPLGDNFKDNLDSRLTAMGLLSAIDKETDNAIAELAIEKSNKNNWFAEEIAQSCNFTRNLLRLSSKRRERVKIKIKKLFGNEDESLTDLTEKNITVCRKRIAYVVVAELTPIYQAKKIASRHLFKFLAKKITKSLMEHSYAPDAKSIRWKVKEFFNDGKVIMSESDCI